MKKVTINGQIIQLTAAEERALNYLKNDGWVSSVDTFIEGRRKWQRYILPTGDRAKTLGVNQPLSPPGKRRVSEFFKKNPRRQKCATGEPRRINTILRQIYMLIT